MRRLLLVVAMAGCVQSGVVVCGESECPAGYVCRPSTIGGCFSPEQIHACTGLDLPDGAICYANDLAGTCEAGGCVVPVCGNGVVESTESCDDGNRSVFDGCTEACLTDPFDWRRIRAAVPRARTQAAMAYDTARERVVLFGGAGAFGDTWELDGEIWVERSPDDPPGPRWASAAAYNAARGVVVLFGGRDSACVVGTAGCQPLLDETWEYDGSHWRLVTTTNSPSAREGAVMVYHAARKTVLLIGGHDGMTPLAETWEYDGTTWTRLSAPGLGARYFASAAYDPKRDVVVVHGGTTGMSDLADTRELALSATNTSWTPVNTAVLSGRYEATMIYDAESARMLLFGGRTSSGPSDDKLWAYAGTTKTWSEASVAVPAEGSPGLRGGAGMVYEPARRRALLFGGDGVFTNGGVSSDANFDDTWELSLAPTLAWRVIDPPGFPRGGREGSAIAYDAVRGNTLLVGGRSRTGDAFVQTWMFDGATWNRLADAPVARAWASMVFDWQLNSFVLFGGAGYTDGVRTSTHGETWTYDGSIWTQRWPATSPTPREAAAMVYDVRNGRAVLFGGHKDGVALDDTWLLEQAGGNPTWRELTELDTRPSPRSDAAIAYDPIRSRVVLFGGRDKARSGMDDTWEFDGARWIERNLPTAPEPRYGAAMTFDPARGRVVLVGGAVEGDIPLGDIWELYPEGWRQLQVFESAPTRRSMAAMVYDSARGLALLHGGRGSALLDDTWALGRVRLTTTEEACYSEIDHDGDAAIGCADDDCWGVCQPFCPPGVSADACPMLAPRCGDGRCGYDVSGVEYAEDCHSCPGDCADRCRALCGDLRCEANETNATCPGDC